jgi:hypothetical protein
VICGNPWERGLAESVEATYLRCLGACSQIDTARAEPVTVVKYGRPVVVVMAVEEYKRLKGLDATDPPPAGRAKKTRAKG